MYLELTFHPPQETGTARQCALPRLSSVDSASCTNRSPWTMSPASTRSWWRAASCELRLWHDEAGIWEGRKWTERMTMKEFGLCAMDQTHRELWCRSWYSQEWVSSYIHWPQSWFISYVLFFRIWFIKPDFFFSFTKSYRRKVSKLFQHSRLPKQNYVLHTFLNVCCLWHARTGTRAKRY